MTTGSTLWQRLRRPDWLGELQTGLIVSLALGALVAAVEIGSLITGGPVPVELSARDITDVTGASGGLAPGVSVAADSTVEAVITDPSIGQLSWYAASRLGQLGVALALLALLLRLVIVARRTDPFTAATVRRLRVLAAVSALGGVATGFLTMFAGLVLSDAATGGRTITTTLSLNIQWLLAAVGFLAIAEVIKRGRALRAELETVI